MSMFPKKLQAYLDWYVRLLRVNRVHERLDPTTKSDVPCAEVRESLSQLRVDGVPSAIQSVEQ